MDPKSMQSQSIRSGRGCRFLGLAILAPTLMFGQSEPMLKHGNLITEEDLPGIFKAVLKKMGSRMMSADKASVTLIGTIADTNGSRPAQITVQAPGYLRFQEGQNADSSVLAFDGHLFANKNSRGGIDDVRIQESLFAHLPDMILLQIAGGGGLRPIGGRFRTDNGKTPNYSGPYWTICAFSPRGRADMEWGQPLQQGVLVAIDESTLLISEVRRVQRLGPGQLKITQTKFNNWFQQGDQWYPGEIARLENAERVLTFTVRQGITGAEMGAGAFKP